MGKAVTIENTGAAGRGLPVSDGAIVFVPGARISSDELGKEKIEVGTAEYPDGEILAKLIAERPVVKHFFATSLKVRGELPAAPAPSQQKGK